MRDLSEQLYTLIAEKRQTLPQANAAGPPAPHAEARMSFAVTIRSMWGGGRISISSGWHGRTPAGPALEFATSFLW